MRVICPPLEREYSVSELAQANAEVGRVRRMTANAREANEINAPALTGTLLAMEVQPGLIATGHDITVLETYEVMMELDGWLGCSILLSGHVEPVRTPGHPPFLQEVERPVVIGFGRPLATTGTFRANQRQAIAGFTLRPDFFDRFGHDVTDDGLARLKSFLSSDLEIAVLPKSRKVTEIARRNLYHPYSGQLAELFLEFNTLAFVVEIANMMSESQRILTLLGRKVHDQVMAAREILDSNLSNPPKSLDLAREVGVNQTTLQKSFKLAFGTSIFSYIRQQRLELSRALLRDTDLNIAEIGYQVGFSRPAAFTAAYRRHFGQPPTRETRRR
jgi:AraC-like DNA-binding protein